MSKFTRRTGKPPRSLAHHGRGRSFAICLSALACMAALVSGCGTAFAPTKVYRVGVLSGLEFFEPAVTGFQTKMAELGYIEGQTIVYDIQSTNVDIELYRTIAQKFVADDVDLIFSFPTEASMEAKAATQGSDIPVVFDLAFTDVAGINLIDSTLEPGGNVTGVRFPSAQIASKRLEILTELAPQARRILVPYLAGYPNVPGQLEAIHAAATALEVEIIELGVASPPELQAALDAHSASAEIDIDAILLIAEPLSVTPVFYDLLGKFSYDHRIPIGGALTTSAAGHASIFGLLPDAYTTGTQAAVLADKIFRGTSAGSIPVVTAESELQINMAAAEALGVAVPRSLLRLADQVMQ